MFIHAFRVSYHINIVVLVYAEVILKRQDFPRRKENVDSKFELESSLVTRSCIQLIKNQFTYGPIQRI